jgi:hypothetical protein
MVIYRHWVGSDESSGWTGGSEASFGASPAVCGVLLRMLDPLSTMLGRAKTKHLQCDLIRLKTCQTEFELASSVGGVDGKPFCAWALMFAEGSTRTSDRSRKHSVTRMTITHSIYFYSQSSGSDWRNYLKATMGTIASCQWTTRST